jgi:tetratricopeptide (TPR) repeat protein
LSPHLINNGWRGCAMVCIALVCTTLGLTACVGSGTGSRSGADINAVFPADATSRYARALGLMDAGKDARAIEEFERITEQYPDYAGPYVNIGIIHGRNARPDAAMLALQHAVETCSGCAATYNQLGIEHRRQGRFEDAEQAYLRAIDANGDYALAYFNLGVLYDLYLGRPDLALQYYEGYQSRRRPAAVDQKDVVDTWIIDLRRRVGKPQQAAKVQS